MDIVASIIKALFGSKADKDRKQIEPYLEKIKAVYPSIEKLTNDELRAHSEALKKQIADFIAADEARIVELKAILEKPETQLEEKEKISKEIDETTKRIDEKIEEVLDKILPEAFAIMKDTARRFAQNETVVVTANDFDRNLAATKDFVTIEGDKAVYATHWLAGGNDTKWDMIHYDVQLFGGVVLHQGKIAEMATGEGKTLRGDAPRIPQRAGQEGRAHGDGEQLPRQARLRVDGPDVPVPRSVGGLHRRHAAQLRRPPRGLHGRHHVRNRTTNTASTTCATTWLRRPRTSCSASTISPSSTRSTPC